MKKFVALLILSFVIIAQVTQAQVKPFRFGLKIAPNIGWISPDSDGYEKDGSLAGFSWGFISDIAITDNYYFGTGFNINYLNGKYSFPDSREIIANDDTTSYPGTTTSDMKLRYIELPLTLKMKTNKFDQLQVYGQIGFSLGLNIKAKAEDVFRYEVAGNSKSQSNERDKSDEVKFARGSLILGGGIEYYIDNSTSIVAGITYSNGISNILKGNNTVDTSVKQKATPHYIELTLGVIF